MLVCAFIVTGYASGVPYFRPMFYVKGQAKTHETALKSHNWPLNHINV